MTILYEDNHLIAIYKPPGLLSQGDSSDDPSALALTKDWLKQKYQKPGNAFLGLVHRLDRPVGGVLVFGKTSKGASRLSEQFRTRAVTKRYEALVEGRPQPQATLEDRLDWDEAHRRAVVSADGKPSSLRYTRVSTSPPGTLLDIELFTGRKHQIRCQLAAAGLAIKGDRHYGAQEPWSPGAIALVCYEIGLTHPIRREETMAIRLPSEFRLGN